MPPVVIAAGIAAAGTLGGAALNSRASNKATDASSKANTEALAYTKEQETARRAEHDKATELWKAQWNAWNDQRMALLQRYGVDVSGMQAPPMQSPSAAPSLMGGGRVDPRTANAIGAAAQGGQTVADILGRGAQPGKWNDWESQGLYGA
jgi:hypothetical protein